MTRLTSTADRLQQQIVSEVRDKIRDGLLKRGEKLPSEKQLADQYMATRFVVRRALRQLEGEQLVEAVQGVGRFVRNQPQQIKIKRRMSLPIETESLEGYGVELRSVQLKKWPEELREKLELKEELQAVQIIRIFKVFEQPLALEKVYLPAGRFPDFKSTLSDNRNSVSRALYSQGVKSYYPTDYQISARNAEGVERRLLECPTYTPVLDVKSVFHDDQGLVQCTEFVGPSDRIQYSIELPERPNA